MFHRNGEGTGLLGEVFYVFICFSIYTFFMSECVFVCVPEVVIISCIRDGVENPFSVGHKRDTL